MTLEARCACRSAGFSRPVVWVYDPHYAPFIGLLGPSGVVFDLVDDLQGYPGSPGSLCATGAYIRLLCDHADRVLLTSEVLAREYSPRAPHRVVANGFDDALFGVGVGAPDSTTRGRPRAGFVGALFDFLDYQLLLQTARRLPEVEFVLAGRRYTDDTALDGLLGLSNVTYLGYQSPERIPALVRTFDVCLCPFKIDRVSRAVSPLKIYEYLALHKPVVATPMEGMRRDPIGRFIDFAAGVDEYAELVRLRATHGRVFDSGLDAVLEASTWERRCREVAAFVRDVVTDADPTCV
jgi:glycosyltransferase involved in cell wall biosynthesis